MTKIIDGKKFAENLTETIAKETQALLDKKITPGLAVILVGDDPASEVYVRNKKQQAVKAGFKSIEHKLPKNISQQELLDVICRLNDDRSIHGILVQLPLPETIDENAVINMISPDKDVDGFTQKNVGRLNIGQPCFVPCTPLGCLLILQDHFKEGLSGKHAVIIGRSNIVGKPMASLLLKENCTVTIVHSKTQNIKGICQTADILVAAVGQPKMVNQDWIKKDAVLIDVGINRITVSDKTKLVGDIDIDSIMGIAGAVTPVPGGVGPMTIACLLLNTLKAAQKITENNN